MDSIIFALEISITANRIASALRSLIYEDWARLMAILLIHEKLSALLIKNNQDSHDLSIRKS